MARKVDYSARIRVRRMLNASEVLGEIPNVGAVPSQNCVCPRCGYSVARNRLMPHMKAGKGSGCGWLSSEEARGFLAGVACAPADEPSEEYGRKAVNAWKRGYDEGRVLRHAAIRSRMKSVLAEAQSVAEQALYA